MGSLALFRSLPIPGLEERERVGVNNSGAWLGTCLSSPPHFLQEFNLTLTCPTKRSASTLSTAWTLCWRPWGKQERLSPTSAPSREAPSGSLQDGPTWAGGWGPDMATKYVITQCKPQAQGLLPVSHKQTEHCLMYPGDPAMTLGYSSWSAGFKCKHLALGSVSFTLII